MKTYCIWISVTLSLFPKLNCGEVGENCIDKFSRQEGICVLIEKCPHALTLLEQKRSNEITNCGFDKTTPIVCCPDTVLDPDTNEPESTPNPDVNPKCSLYYDIRKTPDIGGDVGLKSSTKELFPHMAIIGYGDPNDIQWLCGGSLISEKFILTAAHCLRQTDYGLASFVRLGVSDLTSTTGDAKSQDFLVSGRIAHPYYYKRRSHYHDIGLIKLKRFVDFNEYVKPACLFIRSDVTNHHQLIATVWGMTRLSGEPTSIRLLKMHLKHVCYEVCKAHHLNESPAKLAEGIVDEIQICAESELGTDTCPEDSGGPLQTLQYGRLWESLRSEKLAELEIVPEFIQELRPMYRG